jgi:hypothetical protein
VDAVRQAAFRALLGEDIYALAQAREDAAQGELLIALLALAGVYGGKGL